MRIALIDLTELYLYIFPPNACTINKSINLRNVSQMSIPTNEYEKLSIINKDKLDK